MSSSPRYRFFLDGTKQISEPIGWNKIKIELNRDTTYWSLVESVELPFEFYGNSPQGDGGYEYLKEVKQNGVDSQVEFLAQISWDYGNTWDVFFEGLLDLTTLLEIRNKRRFQCGIVRQSNWTRFYNLRDNPVQIVSTDTIDHDLVLPPQKIRQIYEGSHGDDVAYTIGSNEYGIIDWRDTLRNEITEVYNLPRTDDPGLPVWKFGLAFDGDYTIVGEIYITSSATYPAGAPNQIPNIEIYTQINDTQFIWTKTNQGTNGIDGRTHFTYSATHSNLLKGDRIRIYFYNTSGVGSQSFVWTDFFAQLFTVTADTVYMQTTAPAFLIHDVADRILQNIVGEHYLYSEYFGGVNTDYIDYSSDGCGVSYELTKGIHIRGKLLSDKPFALSWNQLWAGLNPIFLLGAGYEYVRANLISGGFSEKEMLVVMPREYFFDATEQSVTFTQYEEDFRLEISYDPQFLITSIKQGYQKWQAQSISGIDDPQTIHTRTTRLKTAGEDGSKNIEQLSTFIAASLAIEQGRRLTQFLSQDWPLDEDVFIVQVSSPTTTKLYSSTLITNLLNSSTRYNVRLTPASNFNRWAEWFSIAFQAYIGDVFKFSNGEGNTDMQFHDPAATACNAEPGKSAVEDGDIEIVESKLQPDLYKFQVAMTWEQYKAIRDNRKLSIALNYLDQGQNINAILFINNLVYYPNESKAELKCWLNMEIKRFKQTVQLVFDTGLTIVGPTGWKGTFICEESNASATLHLVGASKHASFTKADFFGGTRVMTTIEKSGSTTTNGNTTITWTRGGFGVVHTVFIPIATTVGIVGYTFTNVQEGEALVISILEG